MLIGELKQVLSRLDDDTELYIAKDNTLYQPDGWRIEAAVGKTPDFVLVFD